MRLLYFAWLKTKMGRAEEEVDPPADVADVASLLERLSSKLVSGSIKSIFW